MTQITSPHPFLARRGYYMCNMHMGYILTYGHRLHFF